MAFIRTMFQFFVLPVILVTTLCACGDKSNTHAAREGRQALQVEGPIHSLSRQADSTYQYNHTRYDSLGSIPFDSSGILFVDYPLSHQEAGHLMSKGIGFVFNNKDYFEQRHKRFKLLFAMPKIQNTTLADIKQVQDFYHVDQVSALLFTGHTFPLMLSDSVIKVTSPEEIVQAQDQVIGAGRVPILFYHASIMKQIQGLIRPGTHFILSNSFPPYPERYLDPKPLFDIQSIGPAIVRASAAPTLGGFYATFRESYAQNMIGRRKVATLLYVAGAAPSGEGRTVVAYYDAPTQ